MRPVNKLSCGQPYTDDSGAILTVKDTYKPYSLAKSPLCANFGLFCIYCETPAGCEPMLHVEHILPKDAGLGYSHLEFKWENFLLSCPVCNNVKTNKIAGPQDCHYPHLNNTFLSLCYDRGGVVSVNPTLVGTSSAKAKKLLELVGLDRTPETSSAQDKRWMRRSEAWNIAERYRDRYDKGKVDIDLMIDYVKAKGYWSIWFTVFNGYDQVRQRLISDFPGTASQCFDPVNHFDPIERNPGSPDPV